MDYMYKYPYDISLVNPSEFSVQELKILAEVRANKAKVTSQEIFDQIKDLEEQIKNLPFIGF